METATAYHIRRSRNTIPTPSTTPQVDDLLLPASGPNGVPPDKMTPRERREEIIAILARGMLRKAHGISPFTKPDVNNSA